MDVKTVVQARRIGKKTDMKYNRAVKVTLPCPSTVKLLLGKAKDLRLSETTTSIYLCPDRSPEERKEWRELVVEVKRRITTEPEKRHFIQNGQVNSVVRNPS